MTSISHFDSANAVRILARATAAVATIAVLTSLLLMALSGSIEITPFSLLAAVGGAYSAKVGWRKA